jgi:GH15 family glucan-1,4-alpha-glucosidase
VALVASDGSIDWLALPDLDSPAVFAALLDPDRGGRCWVRPDAPFTSTRRYDPGTNVLETTFTTASGVVRVIDALLFHGRHLAPLRELVRHVEGVSGTVAMRWVVQPRFGYGSARTSIGVQRGVPVAASGADAVAVVPFDAGEPTIEDGAVTGRFDARAGTTSILVLASTRGEPLVLPSREGVLRRLGETREAWRRWTDARPYDGPFREAVLRSGLALRLLVFSPSGAIAGAATTSLPEEVGGVRNWDYRYSWVRDAAFTLGSLLTLDCPVEGEAYFWWLMHASQITQPHLKVLYGLDGGSRTSERTLDLAGYRGSLPVRVGNAAAEQSQLDIYGALFLSAWLYATAVQRLDREVGVRLARTADLVAEIWRTPDSGIWEVRSAPRHYTQSKIMCWVALDRAIALAGRGMIPRDGVERWSRARHEIRTFVEERCWSERRRSYVRAAGSDDLDASVLHASMFGFDDPRGPRMLATLDAIERELRDGPLVDRYLGEDGLPGREGAFLACSFWLADALARAGRLDHAGELMERLIGMANDVGLYAEEIDPRDGAFLGNFPQALTHLALIGAAASIDRARNGGP